MKITVIDTAGCGKNGAWWHIHKAGCRDIKQEANRFRSDIYTVEVESAAKYAEEERASLNHDRRGECDGDAFGPEAFRIMPCVTETI